MDSNSTTSAEVLGSGILDDDKFERILAIGDVRAGGRRAVRLSTGRGVVLFNTRKGWFAMDHACYHHGGPLLPGDIEDVHGSLCVVCPWHKYRIALETGEGLYFGIDPLQRGPDGKPTPVLKSKGVKQRVHAVKLHDGHVWIRDDGAHTYGAQADDADGEACSGAGASTPGSASTATATTASSSANPARAMASRVHARIDAGYELPSDEYALERTARTQPVGIHSSRL